MPGNARPISASTSESANRVRGENWVPEIVPDRSFGRKDHASTFGPVVTVDRTDADDRTLLSQMRAGEASAFAALFDRYYDRLRVFADSMVGSATEAEEIAEDVFVRIWETRAQLEIRSSVRSYLYAATRNHAINRLRSDSTRRHWLEEAAAQGYAPGMGRAPDEADTEVRVTDLTRAIDAAIAQLPPRCRQVFLLHRQHGMSHQEIADAMETSVKTAENQMARALKLLRDRLAVYLDQ